MQVIEHITQREQKEHKGHNRPHVTAGTPVYVIFHAGLVFSYAYLNKEYAEHVLQKFKSDPDLKRTIDANFRKTYSSISARTSDR